MKSKILFAYWIPQEIIDSIKDDFDPVYPAEEIVGMFSPEEIRQLVVDCEVVMLGDQLFDKASIDAAKKLKAIGRSGAGCDAIDCEYAGKKGIPVINAPSTVTQPTAELTIAVMLDVARCVSSVDRKIRQTGTCFKTPSFVKTATCLYGKTLGIIGFGRIGRQVALKAKGLDMKIVYADAFRAPKEVEDAIGARQVSQEELLRTSDFVSLHCPYLPENHHLINAKTLAMMKPSAYLVNASRGKMVEEAALIEALKNQTIRGAAIDVYEFEPKIGADLLTMENVVLTPHMGTWVYEARVAMVNEALDGVRAFLKGQTPPNLFNKEFLVR